MASPRVSQGVPKASQGVPKASRIGSLGVPVASRVLQASILEAETTQFCLSRAFGATVVRNLQNIGRSYIFHTSEGSRDASKMSKNRSGRRSLLRVRSKSTWGPLRKASRPSRATNSASKTANMAPKMSNLAAETAQLGLRSRSECVLADPGCPKISREATRDIPNRPKRASRQPKKVHKTLQKQPRGALQAIPGRPKEALATPGLAR